MSIKSEIKEIQTQVQDTKAKSGRYVREVWDYIKYTLEKRLESLEKQQEELAKKGNKKEEPKIKPQIEELRSDIKNLSASISEVNKISESKASLDDLPNFDAFKALSDDTKKQFTKVSEEQSQQRKWVGDLGRQYREIRNTIDSKVKDIEDNLSSLEQKIEFQEPKIIKVVEEKNNDDIYDKIKELESRIEKYKKSIPIQQDHRQKFENIDSELSYLKSELSKVDKKVSRTDLKDKIKDLYQKISDVEKVVSDFPTSSIEAANKKANKIEKDIKSLEAKNKNVLQLLQDKDKEISSIKKDIKKSQENLSKEKESKDLEIEELKQMIFALKEENKSLRSKCLDRIYAVEEQLK